MLQKFQFLGDSSTSDVEMYSRGWNNQLLYFHTGFVPQILFMVLESRKNPMKMIFLCFMYRRPTLCPLHIAVDFLKSLKIAVVIYYIPVDDGRGQVLGCNVMPNIERHRPGIEPRPPPDRMWTLYH